MGVRTACSKCRFLSPRLEVSNLKGLGQRSSSGGDFLPRSRHWAMSGDRFSGRGRDERVRRWWPEPGDAAQQPTWQRAASTIKSSNPNVGSAGVRTPSSGVRPGNEHLKEGLGGGVNAGGRSPDTGRLASCSKGTTVGVPRTPYLGLGLDLSLARKPCLGVSLPPGNHPS